MSCPHLLDLARTIEELLPGAGPVPPGDRERSRLHALLEAAERLHKLPERLPSIDHVHVHAQLPSGQEDAALLQQTAALRQEAARVLYTLAEHASVEVPRALAQAVSHWDQAGSLTLLSAAGRSAALSLQTHAAEALLTLRGLRARSPAALSLLLCAGEAISAVDSACTLLRAVEVRFTALLREQLRRPPPGGTALASLAALLPGGRPFLDPGAALYEVAQAFGGPPPEQPAQEPDLQATQEPDLQGRP